MSLRLLLDSRPQFLTGHYSDVTISPLPCGPPPSNMAASFSRKRETDRGYNVFKPNHESVVPSPLSISIHEKQVAGTVPTQEETSGRWLRGHERNCPAHLSLLVIHSPLSALFFSLFLSLSRITLFTCPLIYFLSSTTRLLKP